MAIWIKAATQEMIEVNPANGKAFTLPELQEIVEGYIESFGLRDHRIMWLNEEGKLKGLPYNAIATEMAHGSGLVRNDYIVGNVLIATREESAEDEEGE